MGYYNEETGEWIEDDAGGLSQPLPESTGNVGSDDWSVDQALQLFYESDGSSSNNAHTQKDVETGRNSAPTPAKQQEEESLWDRITGMANKNKNNPLLQMGLAGIASHFSNQQKSDAATKQQEYAAQVDRDKIAANSASVSGIKPVQGIIQKALRRTNGNAVFQPNGRVAR